MVVPSSHGVKASPHLGCYRSLHSADSYVQASSVESMAVVELAAMQKEAKYSALSDTHIFQPLAFESHVPHDISATLFIKDLGHRILQRSGDNRKVQFLFHRLRVIVQQSKAVLYNKSFLAALNNSDM